MPGPHCNHACPSLVNRPGKRQGTGAATLLLVFVRRKPRKAQPATSPNTIKARPAARTAARDRSTSCVPEAPADAVDHRLEHPARSTREWRQTRKNPRRQFTCALLLTGVSTTRRGIRNGASHAPAKNRTGPHGRPWPQVPPGHHRSSPRACGAMPFRSAASVRCGWRGIPAARPARETGYTVRLRQAGSIVP
jgi:hypothetical protein